MCQTTRVDGKCKLVGIQGNEGNMCVYDISLFCGMICVI